MIRAWPLLLALAGCTHAPACAPLLRPLVLDRQSCQDAINPPPMCVAGVLAGVTCTFD